MNPLVFFTVQERFGALGEKVRDQMLQAGIRDPKLHDLFDSAGGYSNCFDASIVVGSYEWEKKLSL